MKRILHHRPSPGTAFGLAALVIAIGGAAFAAIPDSSGVIHGCYERRGNLRVIDTEATPPQSCRSRETALSWNQQGPQGPPGPPGPSTVRALGDVTLSDGESKVLLSEGPLTLTGTCRINEVPPETGTPQDVGDIAVSTTQDHSAFGGSFNKDWDLSPEEGNGIALRVSTAPSQPAGQLAFADARFFAAAPDSTRLSGVLVASVNGLGRTGKCTFGGHVVVG